jgi:hypothetical protein
MHANKAAYIIALHDSPSQGIMQASKDGAHHYQRPPLEVVNQESCAIRKWHLQ